jgi:2'-5' RNA ligase
MARIGFRTEKRAFSPHLTIGRFRSSRFKEALLDDIGSKQDMSLGSFEVKSVILYRSDLMPSGAVYTKISEAPLVKP